MLGTKRKRERLLPWIQAAYSVGDASDSQRPTLIKEVINE